MMEKKVVDIKNMTLEEKASLCVGEDYWNSNVRRTKWIKGTER